MPAEKRFSNTDPRDVFIRLNPLGLGEAELRKESTGFEDPRTHSDYLLFLAGYRETHPEPQPHPEPIAWMVGTAFWWTKEEAERDAAEMNLPVIGLGPMTDTGEVQRLREALKFYADRDHFAEYIGSDWDTVSGEPANVLWHDSEAWFVEDGSIARAALGATPDSLQLVRSDTGSTRNNASSISAIAPGTCSGVTQRHDALPIRPPMA